MPLTDSDIQRFGEVVKLQIAEALQPVHVRLAEGSKDFEQIRETLTDHDHAINGNGKPGLIDDVKELQREMRQNTQHKQEVSLWRRSIAVAVLGAVASLAVGGTATACLWVIRQIPGSPPAPPMSSKSP